MNILCFNTAFSEAQIALKFMDKNYYEKIDANSKHSENFLASVEKLFEKVIKIENLQLISRDILKKIDVLSVVIGPGSFTGLRISIATAKAILVTNPQINVVKVNSLELIANEVVNRSKITKNIYSVIDALSGFYFVAGFDKKLNCIVEPQMITEQALKKYKNLVSNDQLLVQKKNYYELTPEILLSLTENKIKNNEFITENELSPLYLRPSQAEANLKNGNKN